jgi:hypothetical protein
MVVQQYMNESDQTRDDLPTIQHRDNPFNISFLLQPPRPFVDGGDRLSSEQVNV